MFLLKFGHSEKDTKFEKIFHFQFDVTQCIKFWVEDFFKFCASVNLLQILQNETDSTESLRPEGLENIPCCLLGADPYF